MLEQKEKGKRDKVRSKRKSQSWSKRKSGRESIYFKGKHLFEGNNLFEGKNLSTSGNPGGALGRRSAPNARPSGDPKTRFAVAF